MGGPITVEIVLKSLSTAIDMAKGFSALRGEAERQQLVIDLQAKILEAQEYARAAQSSERGVYEAYWAVIDENEHLLYEHELDVQGNPICPVCKQRTEAKTGAPDILGRLEKRGKL